MCGRFVLDRTTAELSTLFDADVVGAGLPEPSWNLAPTQRISIVLDSLAKATEDDPYPEPVRRIEAARWGLVPSFAKEPSSRPPLITARAEDAAETTSFATAVAKRRAIVPATGYYEWLAAGESRVPHYVSLPDGELMLFAAVYEWWRNPAAASDSPDRWLLSTSILTRSSAGSLTEIHDRMPVFIDADLVEGWLDPQEDGSQELVDQLVWGAGEVAERCRFHRVSASVGSVDNDGEQLIEAVG